MLYFGIPALYLSTWLLVPHPLSCFVFALTSVERPEKNQSNSLFGSTNWPLKLIPTLTLISF